MIAHQADNLRKRPQPAEDSSTLLTPVDHVTYDGDPMIWCVFCQPCQHLYQKIVSAVNISYHGQRSLG